MLNRRGLRVPEAGPALAVALGVLVERETRASSKLLHVLTKGRCGAGARAFVETLEASEADRRRAAGDSDPFRSMPPCPVCVVDSGPVSGGGALQPDDKSCRGKEALAWKHTYIEELADHRDQYGIALAVDEGGPTTHGKADRTAR